MNRAFGLIHLVIASEKTCMPVETLNLAERVAARLRGHFSLRPVKSSNPAPSRYSFRVFASFTHEIACDAINLLVRNAANQDGIGTTKYDGREFDTGDFKTLFFCARLKLAALSD